MSLTARHKKAGGFRKLVNSLETTPDEKRKGILEAMRLEDPDFVSEVEGCLFKFEDFEKLGDLVVAEILGEFQSEIKYVALALYKAEESLVQKFTKNMDHKLARAYRDEVEQLSKVMERERTGARYRMIEKARKLEDSGKFLLKKYSEHFKD